MAICKHCGGTFDWGQQDGRWIQLEPVSTHDDMDRTFVDENGQLRADHRDRHPGGGSVNVQRLAVKVRAEDLADPVAALATQEVIRESLVARAKGVVGL